MTPDQLSLLLPLLLVLAFWLLVLRPARRRQKGVAQTQAGLQPGSRVMLSSGLYGEVASVDDADIRLTVAAGVTLTVHRQAVAKVVEGGAGGPGTAVGEPGATAVTADRQHPPVDDAADRSTDR